MSAQAPETAVSQPPAPRPSRSVRYASVEGIVVILDLRGNAYHLLDKVASAMWLSLAEGSGSLAAQLRRLQMRFDADPEHLMRDFHDFVETALADGLLSHGPDLPGETSFGETKRTNRRQFASVKAWVSFARVLASLRFKGLEKTYDLARSSDISLDAAQGAAAADLAAFSRAENFIFVARAPMDCMPRSLALFHFMRRMGHPVEHVIGVTVNPFAAHAWVELSGRVLLDADWRTTYTVIARLEP
jgi:Transglutaminase-like superfamily/Coenzyme PQQ synthesis protein D (PqqD)